MVPHLRCSFNASFAPGRYQEFLRRLDEACGVHVRFRNSETPCFFPRDLLDRMARYGCELLEQLTGDQAYRAASDAAIPAEFNVPREAPHPLFAQVDFGLVRGEDGELAPTLVEIQGFPSLYAYQMTLAQLYKDAYGLDPNLKYILGRMEPESYRRLLGKAILGNHAPEQVVLMEIDPLEQKTLPDFLLTSRLFQIVTVNVTDVWKEGRRLFYRQDGRSIPIRRIYNRVIVDELIRRQVHLPFSFRDDLEVEWAGHPNWFFRLSKFSIPHFRHICVPRSWYLDQVPELPDDLKNYVLKPLFSYAGLGVVIGPSQEHIDAIPPDRRSQYLLQERVTFEPVIETPFGLTQAELRIMFIWMERPIAGPILVRTGRSTMMGVDHNRNLQWVGASAGLYLDD